ncbi:hypothetical protein ABEO66_12100 [Bacillus pacificus]|uniref:hypothetical protein n=1 Tax=Bacillus pacificus TaxID=2026187 RepID=UPI003D1FCAED
MELRKTADGQSFIIEIEKKKSSLLGTTARSLLIIAGLGAFILSIFLFISIIGILFAIPLSVISIALIAGGLGYQRIECPNCNRKQSVRKSAENFSCRKCKKNTLIDWK